MYSNRSEPAFKGEILFRASTPLSHPKARYQGFSPGETVYPAGTVMREGARPLTCDIVFRRDVPIKLRDGVTVYTDVFLPADTGPVPAIIAWSPYGKNLGSQHIDDFPFRMGVPQSQISELNKWEAPDPALWCAKGYAVVNPDARGAYSSEGDEWCWAQQEGCDGADVVEWVGSQDWCTGKVGLAGNSWLAASQWFIAAERPRYLAAIAPWEGVSDVYRNMICPGGVPDVGFMDYLITTNAGQNKIEDLPAMLERYPLFNEYWEDHAAKIERIEVPAYVVASYASPLHVHGTFDGFRRLKGDKWLRVHHIQEWPDFYDPAVQEDLGRFFDRYLKGADNGWEATPKVRLSVFSMGPDNAVVTNRAEADWPIERTRHVPLYLDAASRSGSVFVPQPGSVEISAAVGEAVAFEIPIDQRMEMVGYPELVLFAEARNTDDFDLYIRLQKLNADGSVYHAMALPEDSPVVREHLDAIQETYLSPFKFILFYEGPWGRLRASHRAVDPALSLPGKPHLPNDRADLLQAGEVVELRIGLLPTAIEVKPGESLRVMIETRNVMEIPYGDVQSKPIGKGEIVIHTGGEYASHLYTPDIAGS